MYSILQFRHIGNVRKGKEQPTDDEPKKWSGVTEIYTLSEVVDNNRLTVEIDILDEHLDFFKATLPRARKK